MERPPMNSGGKVDRQGKRSRSPSDRAVIPRLSLQNSDELEPSPRTPLSPRVPLSPRAGTGNPPSTPRSHRPAGSQEETKTSPRFGTPRDENLLDTHRSSPNVSRTSSSSKRRGSTLSARSGSNSARLHRAGSTRDARNGSRRPNPLLSGSPPVRSHTAAAPPPHAQSSPSHPGNNSRSRLSVDSSDSSVSKTSEYASGPSLAGENVGSAAHYSSAASLTPYASTTSLHLIAHAPTPAAHQVMAAYGQGDEAGHRSSTYSAGGEHLGARSLRSYADSQAPRSSRAVSHAETEDFHAVQSNSNSGFITQADLEADSEVYGGLGSEQVEVLCDKAEFLVRQLGACAAPPSSWEALQTARSTGFPWSDRSSPGPKGAGVHSASPRTPTPVGTGGASPIDCRSSPAPGTVEVATDAGFGSAPQQELADLQFRLARMEQAMEKGSCSTVPNPTRDEVETLRKQLHAVQTELSDVRNELREAHERIAQMMAWQKGQPMQLGSSAASSAPSSARAIRPGSNATAEALAGKLLQVPSRNGSASSPRKGPRVLPSPPVPVQMPLVTSYTGPYSGSYTPPVAGMGQHITAVQATTPPPTVRVHTAIHSIALGSSTMAAATGQTARMQTVPWSMPSA